jgi:hypothetical protein
MINSARMKWSELAKDVDHAGNTARLADVDAFWFP